MARPYSTILLARLLACIRKFFKNVPCLLCEDFSVAFKRFRLVNYCSRSAALSVLICFCGFFYGCSTPLVKPGAFDPLILERTPLPGSLITQDRNSEHTVIPDIGWMEGINSTKNLTFAGFRPDSTSFDFCLVITCEPASDKLVLLPLDEGETPLAVLSNQKRRQDL